MPTAITLTITDGRALVADGRLVAGESADVSVLGGVPAALYLVDSVREVVAACTSFVPGETSGTGVLDLATVPLAEIVGEVPAGRAVPLQAIVEDAAGAVIGYGLVNVVSAPMPDALDPLDEDLIYAKLSDLQAYLTRAQADALYAPIDSATPVAPSTDPSAAGKPADAYQTGLQLAGKQTSIADLDAIRAGAAAGATAYQLPATGIPETDLAASVQMSLRKADAAAPADDLRYELYQPTAPDLPDGEPLRDRAVNLVRLLSTIQTLDLGAKFPAAVTDHARDFLIRLELAANVAAPQIAFPQGVTIENADGAVPTIATTTTAGETAVTLLYFSETKAGYFLLKGEAVTEVA